MPRRRPPEDEGNKFDYFPHNINNRPRNKFLLRYMNTFGFSNWRDIVKDWRDSDYDNKKFRNQPYNTPQEVIREYKDRGIWQYVKIMYNPVDGFYYAYVDYTP